MLRFLRFRREKVGLPPGSLIYLGEGDPIEPTITCLSYSRFKVDEKKVSQIEDCLDSAEDKETVTWVDVTGLSDANTMLDIEKQFGVHRLWLEDVLNTDHRPKVDELNDLLFLIVKAVTRRSKQLHFEQVSLFMGDCFVLTFQEKPEDTLNRVKERIRGDKGRIREANADYLIYALVDSIADDYFVVMDELGEEIEKMELSIAQDILKDVPQKITSLKYDLLYLNRALNPIRDGLALIERSSREDINVETRVYFRDAFEHSVQLLDTISDYRQMLDSLMEFHQSRVDTKLNEVMKVLTIFASLFIPLTFIAGIFGMNFENLPGLKWYYGYHASLGIMFLIALVMLAYFKKKKWF